MAKLDLIDTALLDDHPDNPRIAYRDDVVDAIVANLNGEWPQQHALIVRPVGERFQILSGHTRRRAAERADIEAVWCWVDDLEDDAAYMLLATSNAQGELSPLEIGRHALHCKTLEKKGRGHKGGLSEYARILGRAKSTISEYCSAAEVLEKCSVNRTLFLDKAQHLAAIHKLPKDDLWQMACENLGDRSAVDTRGWVEECNSFHREIAEMGRWEKYLPPIKCTAAVIAGRSSDSFRSLAEFADRGVEVFSKNKELATEWVQWLEFNAGGDSWRDMECVAKRQELLDSAKKAHVANNSGVEEWYTPPPYIEAARSLMGGIDLDPASCTAAQETVGAQSFFTKEDDGLSKDWGGRVWMNPPYSSGVVDEFCTKLVSSYSVGAVSEAVVLVNNATDTKWFHDLASHASFICFPRGRVKFLSPGGEEGTPLQGQAILYLGASDAFGEHFGGFGIVVRVDHDNWRR